MPYSFTVNCAGLCAALAIAFVMFALPFALRADSIDMGYVASGKVLVGDDSNLDDEKPTHFVSTSDYFIDVYEVNMGKASKSTHVR